MAGLKLPLEPEIDDSNIRANAKRVAEIVAKMFGDPKTFENVENKVKSLDDSIAKVGSSLESVRSKLDAEKNIKVPTAEYRELQEIVKSVESELIKNLNAQERMETQAQKSPIIQQYQSIKEALDDAYKARERLLSEGKTPTSRDYVELQTTIYPLEESLEKIQPKVEAILAPMELIDRKIRDQQVDLKNLNAEMAELEQAGKKEVFGGDTEKIKQLEAQEQAILDKQRQQMQQRANLTEAQAQYVAKQIEIKANAGEINSEIGQTVARYNEVKKAIEDITTRQKELEGAGRGLGYSEYDNNLRALQQLKAEHDALKQQLDDYRNGVSSAGDGMSRWQGIIESVRNGFSTILGHVREIPGHLKIFDRLKGVAKSISDHFKNMGKHMQSVAKEAKKSAQHLGKSTLRIAKALIGVRGLFALIRKIKAAIKEGITNLSKAEDLAEGKALKDNLDTLTAKFTQLKNSIGAAFAPLIQVVTPIISRFVDTLTNAFNSLAQFIGALSGVKTVAIAKILDKDAVAAENLGKKQEKANKQLMKFDELNNITTTDKDTSNMFESVGVDSKFTDLVNKLKEMWKLADFTELGRKAGEAFKTFLDGIPWDKIQENAYKLGKSLATLINGFIKVDKLGYSIGKTFAEGINTIFHALYGFIHNLDWTALGHFLADGLNGLFENIDWDLIRKTFIEGAQGLVDAINEFIKTFHWDNLSTFIANAINVVVETIKTFFQGIDWSDLGYNLGTQLVETIKKIDWVMIGEALGSIIRAAFDFLVNFVKGLLNGDVGSALLTALKDFFTGLFKGLGLGEIFSTTFGECSFIDSIINIGENIARNLFGGIKKWIESDGENIKNSFLNIFNIWDGIGERFSLFLSDLSSIFDVWGSEDGQQITADILSIFSTAFTSVLEIGSHFISDVVSLIFDPIHEHKEEIQGLFEDFTGYASTWFDFIKTSVETITTTLETLYNEHIAPLFNTLKEVISGALDAIFAVWNDTLKPVIDSIMADFPAIKESVLPVIEEIGEAIGAFIDFATAVVKSMYDTLKPVFEWIHEHLGPVFKTILTGMWQTLKLTITTIGNLLKPAISFIKNVFKLITDLINGDWKAAWDDCKNIFNDVITFIENLIQGFLDFFKLKFTSQARDAEGWGNDLTSNLARGISSGIDKVKTAVSGVADKIRSFLHFTKPDEGPLADFDTYMPDMMKGLANGIQNSMGIIKDMMTQMTNIMATMIKSLDMNGIGHALTNALVSGLQMGISAIQNTMKQFVSILTGFVKNVDMGKIGSTLTHSLISGLQSGISGINSVMNNIARNMGSSLSNIVQQARRWGMDLMQGLINGIYSMFSYLTNAVSNVANTIWSYLHFSEPEVGPLKDFHTFMPDMMDNMVSGIEQGIPDVEAVLSKLSYGIAGGVTIPPKMAENIGRNTAQAESSLDASTLSSILANTVGSLNLGGNSQQDNSDIVIQIDGKEIFRAVRNENNSFINRTGRSAFVY